MMHAILDLVSTAAIGTIMGIFLSNPVTDTGNKNTHVPEREYVRIGNLANFQVDIDKKSIKVDWRDGENSRVVQSQLRLTPVTPTFLLRDNKSFVIEHHVANISVDCASRFPTVVNAHTLSSYGTIVALTESPGPLAAWQNFGVQSASILSEAFCTNEVYQKSLKRPAMT